MRNKKLLGALLAVTTLATFGLAGCGDSGSNGSASKEDDKTITVAASPTPHAEILNKAVKSLVEKDGYKLEVKEFTDYVQPNTAKTKELKKALKSDEVRDYINKNYKGAVVPVF